MFLASLEGRGVDVDTDYCELSSTFVCDELCYMLREYQMV